jgi:hypothetical protein
MASTVAIPVLPLLHTPLPVTSASVVVLLVHTFAVPVMAAGVGCTVTVVRVAHPAGVV